MDWTKFNNHGESNDHAFEVMCNLLFEAWIKATYGEQLVQFSFVNGDGGDGGVEAYGVLSDGKIIGVQSKWFPNKLDDSQINQIYSSFKTALKVRPAITKYVVCLPRNLGSKRIVKGGAVSDNTEANRWEKVIIKCKQLHPDVDIILWDETTIQGKLTQPEAQGIFRYWFDNSVVFDISFKTSYDKTVNSWAKLKYIPELHTAGYIHNRLEYFLGSVELTKRRFDAISEFIKRFEALFRAYEDLLKLGIPETEKELEKKIQNDLQILERWINTLEENKIAIKCGGKADFVEESLDLSCNVTDIKDSPLHFGKYFHFREIEKLLENIEDDFYSLRQILEEPDSNKIIFLGMQGTGKTAGIVSEASELLQSRAHLPVIVHAKEYSEGETWTSIITKTLGLTAEWNESELLGALQNAAILRNYGKRQEFFVNPKCVIIVDGIDESLSWKFWRDKIEETIAFQNTFPRIKFVFLSRPYVFEDRYDLEYRGCFFSVPITGDGDLETICDKYFAEYKIDIGDNHWIKKNLKTPVSVKLFCDIYRNSKITSLPHNTVVLTELYKAKIKSLEENYNKKYNLSSGSRLVQTALIELAELFAKSRFIRYQEIYDKVSEQLKGSLKELLDYLINEGFIYSYVKQEDEFSIPEILYSWGMQPAFDYLIAQKMYRILTSGERIEIKNTDGIYQMLSLISIEEGKLITEHSNVKIENQKAFELICYALANCSINAAEKYKGYLKELMNHSVSEFREIFNNVIQPVLKSDGHPLGAILLDDFLRSFDNPAERDIWWSIPAYLRDNYNEEWRTYYEIDFDSIELHTTDRHTAAPLVLLWSLSSVDNGVRQRSRLKLTEWGIEQPLEFWKLFEKCSDINDEQILEDTFAIAFGIAMNQFICEEYLETASKWIVANVFTEEGLRRFENVVLRYYGAGIVKISISRGLLDAKTYDLVNPPYNYEPNCLPIYNGALNSGRMGGYKAIDYDLARYVLCDRFDVFFRLNYETQDYHVDAKKLIEKYKIAYALSELKVDGLIISIAYKYLLNKGWSPEMFWSYEDENKIGVDIAIRRIHYPATHGEMSRVMTIAEKNVWLARHHIYAVFANEIPLCEDYKTFKYVKDYSQLENFVNTYQDYANTLNRSNEHCWFNAELLAVPSFESVDREKIVNWLQETQTPLFEKWLNEYENEVILNTVTDVHNNISGVSETVWISAGIVMRTDFTRFLSAIESYFEDRDEILNVSDFHAYQDCRGYCTPQEACLIHSEREICSNITIPHPDGSITVQKLTLRCLSADDAETEKYFMLPSKLARSLTGIVYGDGYSYSDKDGNTVARYSSDGEHWGNYQQTLFINNESLLKGLEASGYALFWLFRVYREPSMKARELYTEIMQDKDTTFLVWKEGEEYKYKELKVIQPIRETQTKEIDDMLDSFFEEYALLDE